MELLDFWCPPDGDLSKPCVKIKIPAECCGTKSIVYSDTKRPASAESRSLFVDRCPTHMSTYKLNWAMWIENKDAWEDKPKRRRPCKHCRK